VAEPWYITMPVDEISLDLAPKVIEILRSELSEKNITGLKDQVMKAQAAVEDMQISRDAYAEMRDQARANMRNQGACLQATIEENRQLKDLLAQARSALADFMNTLECRQIEEREIRDQFGPMAARVGILTPEAHSMGYLAKELIPPIMDQLTEALEYGRKTCVLADLPEDPFGSKPSRVAARAVKESLTAAVSADANLEERTADAVGESLDKWRTLKALDQIVANHDATFPKDRLHNLAGALRCLGRLESIVGEDWPCLMEILADYAAGGAA
jgi:hypothetical protein